MQASEFHQILEHVLGQPLAAAGFLLEAQPMQQARGLFRYQKKLDWYAFIEFQMLYYPQSELARFRVNLLKNSQAHARSSTTQEHDLAYIIWHHYAARVLPGDSHWWLFKHPHDLAPQLVAAGKLLFGYGVPWLEAE